MRGRRQSWGRTLFMATASGGLLSMPLAPPGTAAGTGTAIIEVAATPDAHKASIEAARRRRATESTSSTARVATA